MDIMFPMNYFKLKNKSDVWNLSDQQEDAGLAASVGIKLRSLKKTEKVLTSVFHELWLHVDFAFYHFIRCWAIMEQSILAKIFRNVKKALTSKKLQQQLVFFFLLLFLGCCFSAGDLQQGHLHIPFPSPIQAPRLHYSAVKR